MVKVTINKSILELVEGNITEQETDAIVNAANSSLLVEAAWMGQSIGREGQRYWRNAGNWADVQQGGANYYRRKLES